MGRLILLDSDETSLTAEEIEEAIAKKEIALPEKYSIDDQGIVRVPIADIRYLLRLRTDSDRRYALTHGRRGLSGKQARVPDTSPLPPESFIVSEIHVSTGPMTAIIEHYVRDNVHHLASVLLDPFRSTGMGKGRQVEIYNSHDEEIPRESVSIGLRFYPNKQNETNTKVFDSFSLPTRGRIHAEGMRPSDTLFTKPELLSQCFTDIGQTPSEESSFAGKIVSPDGTTPIHWEPTYNWYKQSISEAARHGKRNYDPRTNEISRILEGATSANGRLLITHHLPSASHLEELSNHGGVKTFVFRSMELHRQIFEGTQNPRPKNNFYIDATTHKKLMELEKQGCEFIWLPWSICGDEDPRIFYKNFFVKPDAKDRYDAFRKNGTGIAMFGSSIPDIEDVMRSEIETLGTHLHEIGERHGEIAVLEGGGPGVMQMARSMAKKNRFLNFSFGMDFEQVGERPDFSPEALLLFQSDQIEYRQQFFEYLHTIPILNLGGKGTLFELALSFLKTGLGTSLPIPIYLFDPVGKNNHFYDGMYTQIEAMTNENIFTKPLCQPWTRNLLIRCHDAKQITDHMNAFMKDPLAFWKECHINERHLRTAFLNHMALCGNLQIQLPRYLQNAIETLNIHS